LSGPIIHIATANSCSCKKLLLYERRKCWLWLRSVVRFCRETGEREREYLLSLR